MIKLIIIPFLAKSLSAGSLLPSLKGPERRSGGPYGDQPRPTGVTTANHAPAPLGKRQACVSPQCWKGLLAGVSPSNSAARKWNIVVHYGPGFTVHLKKRENAFSLYSFKSKILCIFRNSHYLSLLRKSVDLK